MTRETPMRFAVTCWVASQYGDTVDAATVLEALRRYQQEAGEPAAAAAALAAIRAGGPVTQAHLDTIASALQHDGQLVSTSGEPQATDEATDFTVELLGEGRHPAGSASPDRLDQRRGMLT